MAGLDFIIRGDNSDFLNKLKEIQNGVRSTADKIEQSGMTIEGMFSRLTKAAAAFGAGFSATEFVKQIARVRGEFQQLEVAFTTMLGGSQEAANDLMQQMVKLAATTPFDLQGVADGARQLLAYGENVNNITDDLTRLGNIAAGLSQPLGDLVYLYGTTMTQGRLYTQDLNQFVGRGIPMISELAKQMGVAEEEVRNLVTEGKIGFPEVQKVIQSLTNEGGMFYNLMQEQSKTITGQISNIEDSISMMFNNIGKSSEGVINTALSGVSYLVENYESVGEAIMAAVVAYGSYRAILMTVTAAQTANSLVLRQAVVERSLATAAGINLSNAEAVAAARTKLLTIAQQGLVKSLKSVAAATILNPYVLAAAAITGLIAVIYKYSTAASAAEEAQNGFNRSMENMANAADELKQKVTELVSIIQDANATPLQKQMAYDELADIAPAITETYDSIEKLSEAGDKWNKIFNEITDKNKEQSLREQISKFQEYVNVLESYNSNVNYREAVQGMKSLGLEGNWTMGFDDWAEAGREQISLLSAELSKIEEEKRKLEVPTELDVRIAESAYNESKERLDDLEKFALALKDEIEGNAIEIPLDDESPRRKTDEIVSEIEDKVEALKKEQRDNPIQFTADKQQVLDQYSSMLTQIQSWKEQARSTGIFTIPLFVTQVRSETEQKQQRFNYLTGKYESEEEKATTLADDYKAAEKAYNNARASLAKMTANRNKYTSEEYKEATSALKTAKKNFEELGGTTQTHKQRQSAATKAANERKKEAEQRKKAQEELNKDLLSLQQQNQDDEIALMQDGTRKRLAEIDNDYKKRTAEIDRQEVEFKKKNKKAGATGLTGGLTQEQQTALQEARDNAAKEQERQTNEIYLAEAQAMRDYLKQYGTFQQQKLAIAEEYAEKIKNAQNEGERLTLVEERDRAIGNVNLSAIRQNIDWGSVFGDFGAMLRDEIETTLDYLRQYMRSDEYKAMSPTDQAQIAEAVENMRVNVTGDLSDVNFKQIGELTNEFQNAQRKMISAQSSEIAAYDNLKKAQTAYKDALANGTAEQQAVAKSNLDNAQSVADNMSRAYQDAVGEFNATGNNLKDATQTAVDAINSISNSISQLRSGSLASAYQGIQGLTGTLGKSLSGLSGFLGNAGKALSKFSSSLGGAAGEIVSAALGVLDLLKDGIGSIIADLTDLIFNAVNGILDDVFSGDIITKPLQSVVKGAGNILNTISFGGFNSLLGIGSNAKEVQEAIDRLTDRNESLQQSIDDLKDTIQDASGAQSVEAARKAEEYQREQNENYLQIAREQARYSGAHHSWNYYWNGFSDEQIKKFSEQIGRAWNGDIFDLSPEEMKLLRGNIDMWEKIQNTGKGNYGGRLTDKLDDYIDQAGKLEEITNTLNETLTQISFDSLYDSFIDTLMDMDASAEDFADNFSEYLMRAVLSNQVGSEFKDRLQEWYEQFASAMEDGGLSDGELSSLRDTWDSIVNDGLALRDELAAAIGYDKTSSSTQSASSKGFETMSQDTADELNGRFTALYEVGLRIDDSSRNIRDSIINTVTGINSLVSLTTDGNAELRNILAQQVIANSYLEDIVKYTKPIPDLGTKLDRIVAKVNNL